MLSDFLKPVSSSLIDGLEFGSKASIGNTIKYYTVENGFPELENFDIAIFDVRESRGGNINEGAVIGADAVRKQFYTLFPGNWGVDVVDLGTILPGNSLTDTYFAVKTVVADLIKRGVLPVVIGGTQDLIYSCYRAYDELDRTVNLSVVSPRFNFGFIEENITSASFLSKIILNKPNNLFGYTNLGYQTYYNSQEEIDLIESLQFEALRLGVLKNTALAEPVMRDSDIVAVDMSAVKQAEAPANENASPNGITGEELCALARYAGLSDKLSLFGIFEYNSLFDNNDQTAKLLAQTLWYFIEGVSLRAKDYPFDTTKEYLKYIVPTKEGDFEFLQSHKTGRWWYRVKIANTNDERHALVPCNHQDYLDSIEGKVPDKWHKINNRLNTKY